MSFDARICAAGSLTERRISLLPLLPLFLLVLLLVLLGTLAHILTHSSALDSYHPHALEFFLLIPIFLPPILSLELSLFLLFFLMLLFLLLFYPSHPLLPPLVLFLLVLPLRLLPGVLLLMLFRCFFLLLFSLPRLFLSLLLPLLLLFLLLCSSPFCLFFFSYFLAISHSSQLCLLLSLLEILLPDFYFSLLVSCQLRSHFYSCLLFSSFPSNSSSHFLKFLLFSLQLLLISYPLFKLRKLYSYVRTASHHPTSICSETSFKIDAL